MNDPRTTDAVRKLPPVLEALSNDMKTLKEDNKYMKEMLRAIKKSVVRKYGKGES